MQLKILSVKCQPFCSGLEVLHLKVTLPVATSGPGVHFYLYISPKATADGDFGNGAWNWPLFGK